MFGWLARSSLPLLIDHETTHIWLQKERCTEGDQCYFSIIYILLQYLLILFYFILSVYNLICIFFFIILSCAFVIFCYFLYFYLYLFCF